MKKVSVKYTGPFADFTGYGEANRNAITALFQAGVDITTERVVYTNKEAEYGRSYKIAKDLENKAIDYDIKIIHVPSDGYLKFIEPVKYHVGHLFWETDSLSKTWVWNCNLMDEIWTGGEVHKENFRRAGVKVPIFVFPQAINTEPGKLKPLSISGKNGFLFYSIFQWIERKNPRALLESYWNEFQDVDDVTLLLKVYRFGFGPDEQLQIKKDILKWKQESGLRAFPKILLAFDLMSTDDIMRLHQAGDCFVSAHRGEGWGVPQAEASVMGKPIISTNLGGIHEWFEDNKTALLVKWTPEKVFGMDFAPWYEKKQNWAKVDQLDLQGKMRWVYENQSEAKKIGKAAQNMVRNKLSYLKVGTLMKRRLEEIQRMI
jgi:glycosyltransferase involved in cell wall biosynthesis